VNKCWGVQNAWELNHVGIVMALNYQRHIWGRVNYGHGHVFRVGMYLKQVIEPTSLALFASACCCTTTFDEVKQLQHESPVGSLAA